MKRTVECLTAAAFSGVCVFAHAGVADQFSRLLGRAGEDAQTSVYLVDLSSSVNTEDKALYAETAKRLAASLRPGDRIMVAGVSHLQLGEFRLAADFAAPRTGVVIKDKPALARTREAFVAEVAKLARAGNGAAKTCLLDALSAAAQVVREGKVGRRRIVIASDGLEECGDVNFARNAPDATMAQRLIAARKTIGALPDLRDVEVHIVGAGGRDARRYGQIHAFWIEYAKATGAVLASYGRTVPQL